MPKPYTPNDKWSQKAAAEGYRARSVYKLMELDDRFDLLKAGMIVLDLGAAPGSWLQYTSKQIGPKGKVIGLDLTKIEPVGENVELIEQDITDLNAIDRILAERSLTQVDLILSDMAPNTSGVKDNDQWKSIELNRAAVAIAQKFLRPSGACVLKVFRGADFDEFLRELKSAFKDVRIVTVEASRDRSREVYVVLRK